MKRLTFIIISLSAFIAGCTKDLTDIEGNTYKPDALLVHDQSSYWLWLAFIIVIITMFVVVKQLKKVNKKLEVISEYMTGEKTEEMKKKSQEEMKRKFFDNNPNATLNDYYNSEYYEGGE
jgi:F0F1-type ATP synthase membrane subunit a